MARDYKKMAYQGLRKRRGGVKLVVLIKTVGKNRVAYANCEGKNYVVKGRTTADVLDNLSEVLKTNIIY